MNKKKKLKHDKWLQEYKMSMSLHFIKRLNQRHNIKMSLLDYYVLSNAIQNKTSSVLHDITYLDSKTQIFYNEKPSIWYKISIYFKKEDVTFITWVLYSKEYCQIKTVLPTEPVFVSRPEESSILSDWNKQWESFETN